MPEQNGLLTDGFKIINSCSMEEIERRIEWLENALCAYKSIQVIKKVMGMKPEGFQTPPEWDELIPIGRTKKGAVLKIAEYLEKCTPHPAQLKDIQEGSGLSYQTVATVLSKNPEVFERTSQGFYRLKETNAQPE